MPIRLLLATGIFLVALSATALAETRIVFINPGKQDEFFWPAVTDTMRAAAEQFGYDLDVHYAERDAQAMIRLGLAAIKGEERPDILILVNEFQAAPDIVKAANEAGISVLMLLNAFVGQQAQEMGAPGVKYPHWIGSLVPSNRGAGLRMAQSLSRCMNDQPAHMAGGKHHVLVLSGDGRTPASLERTAGMHAALNATHDVVVDRHYQTNWQAPDADRLTRNYLDWAAAHSIAPAGIWAANDALAIGALAVVEERGLVPGRDICIVGLNWSPEAVDLVRQNRMVATDGGHFLAGAWAMVMISDYLDKPPGSRQPIGDASFEMAQIDGDNVERFLSRLADRDWRRIPFHIFKRGAAGYDFSLERILDQLGD
ncbi:monosaccharide ABC transporter substrate-binding protein (CUT2 family) [Dongia mobilis]|uniref:Monosaccharide ABC transporter substrate-binding protein (CUT2 family) n=1 Tax=Dongia mobilis TaxID=578943 RepID=A0A4R6WVE8_9PROT|nr:ABC transporter substrate-binding protein [Dongia mobilis]TDQ83286.1 monosaccharide ABC transporter substrate-binding protein (CUT2 family) [Dongia mobilis]